jgi:primosomal protein N' (replication factor Y)
MSEKYAEIYILKQNQVFNQKYTYSIPKIYMDSVKNGMFVMVPFGNSWFAEGIITDITDNKPEGKFKIKPILSILDDNYGLTEELLNLAYYMKEEYMCNMGEVLKTILSATKSIKKNNWRIFCNNDSFNYIKIGKTGLTLTKFQNEIQSSNYTMEDVIRWFGEELIKCGFLMQNKEEYSIVFNNNNSYTQIESMISKRAKKQKQFLDLIFKYKTITEKSLKKDYKISSDILNKFIENKWIVKEKIENFDINKHERNNIKPKLTQAQKNVLEELKKNVENEDKFHYLHGVTGSGKTEIYMQILDNLKFDEQAIVLVPEISLTPQTIDRFNKRFGNKIVVIHSKITENERYLAWKSAYDKSAKIIIGARSAIFAPCTNLKWIILDEAHDSSYISQHTPKYNTVDIAEKRVQLENVNLLLGSATPTIKQYYYCDKEIYKIYRLRERALNISLPEIKVVDMREELANGNGSFLSKEMYDSLKKTIKNGEQAIFLLNRRGYVPIITCKNCGYVEKCKNCDTSLTYHNDSKKLICHYCGYSKNISMNCPNCGSEHYKLQGIGTQRIEKMFQKLLPNTNILRIDADTTSKKGELEKKLNAFKMGKYQVIIGTQMISKGLDFENVTLVGIINADMGLNWPHYAAGERTFQLLTQVSGRAGRHKKVGKVVLQTYQPDNSCIKYVSKHDYLNFYLSEKALRKEFKFPPFIEIVQVMFSHEIDEKANKAISDFENFFRIWVKENGNEEDYIFPYGKPVIGRLNKLNRWQITVKLSHDTFEIAKNIIYNKTQEFKKKDKKLSVTINVNENFIC